MSFREVVSQHGQFIHIPKGYKRLGNKIILRSKVDLEKELGKIVLQIFPWCDGVFQHHSTEGEFREPVLRHLAGSKMTEIIHRENKVKYCLDISKILFSGGNSGLRKLLVKEVKSGENLLDMFTAVGNLSLQPMVHNKINSYLVEKSEYTYSYLLKTLKLNQAERVTTKNIDSRDLKLEDWADRIFMGYHNIDQRLVDVAITAAKSRCNIHMHPISKVNDYTLTEDNLSELIRKTGVESFKVRTRRIKSFSPGLEHIELTFSIQK